MAELTEVIEIKDDLKEAVKDPDGLEAKEVKDLEAQMSSDTVLLGYFATCKGKV